MKKIFILLLAIGLIACKADVDTNKYFGTKITPDNAIPYHGMLEKMGERDSFPVKVSGTTGDVCQNKGCWMTLTDKDGEEMFVQFEDYGFFMPKDIAGKNVVIDGYAYREVTTVQELKHYASDAGESQEVIDAITEPEEELKFMAKGVILLDDAKD